VTTAGWGKKAIWGVVQTDLCFLLLTAYQFSAGPACRPGGEWYDGGFASKETRALTGTDNAAYQNYPNPELAFQNIWNLTFVPESRFMKQKVNYVDFDNSYGIYLQKKLIRSSSVKTGIRIRIRIRIRNTGHSFLKGN
jgi:hypothetical protein